MGLETGTHIGDLNSSNPVGSDLRSQGDNHLRLVKAVVKTSFGIDHDNASGKHEKVTLKEQSSNPVAAANTGFILTKDDSGDTELYYFDDDGNLVQLTQDGLLAIPPVYSAKAYGGAAISVGTSATLLNLNTESWDPSDIYTPATGEFVPNKVGLWLFSASIRCTSTGTTTRWQLDLYKDTGGTLVSEIVDRDIDGEDIEGVFSGAVLIDAADTTTDYSFYINRSGGSAAATVVGEAATWVSAVYLGVKA